MIGINYVWRTDNQWKYIKSRRGTVTKYQKVPKIQRDKFLEINNQ